MNTTHAAALREPQWRRIYRALTDLPIGAEITDTELWDVAGGTPASARAATHKAIAHAEQDGFAFVRLMGVGYRAGRTTLGTAPYWDRAELIRERFGSLAALADEAHRRPTPLTPTTTSIAERRRILCAALDDQTSTAA